MNQKLLKNFKGSSLLSPAHGEGWSRATINNDSPSASEKILAKPKSRRAKRKGGLGEMNFCPPAVPRSGTEGGKRFCNFALAEYQNRKIFVSLIEKNFGGAQLKNVKKIFLFCSLSGGRKRWAGPALCVKGRDVAQRRFALRPVIATNLNIANFASKQTLPKMMKVAFGRAARSRTGILPTPRANTNRCTTARQFLFFLKIFLYTLRKPKRACLNLI